MGLALYLIVMAITFGSLGLWLYMTPSLGHFLSFNNTVVIDFVSMLVLSSLGVLLLYVVFLLVKVKPLFKFLCIIATLVILGIVFKAKLVENPVYIWAICVGIALCSLLVLYRVHQSQWRLIKLGDRLNIAHTFYRPHLDTYLQRIGDFKIPKDCSLVGMDCFGYIIAIEDFLKVVPALYRYLNNSSVNTINELSAFKSEAETRDLSNPLNKDYLNLLNYILLSKNLLWEFESKWLQLRSRNESIKSKKYLNQTVVLKRKQEQAQHHYQNDDLDLFRVYDYRDPVELAHEAQAHLKEDEAHVHEDILEDNYQATYHYGYVEPEERLNTEHDLVKAANKNKERSQRHKDQAQVMQQEMGIRPSLLGEVSLGQASIKFEESFDFDKCFNTFLRRYSKTMSLRVYAFFQYLAHTRNAKEPSAYVNPTTNKLVRQEIASCTLAVNGALYVSRFPLFLELVKPLVFMLFMALSTYWMLSKYSLSAFIAVCGGFGEVVSILQGLSVWGVALMVLVVTNTLISLYDCCKMPHFDIGYELLKQVRLLQGIVALLSFGVALLVLWPGQLTSVIMMAQQDLAQIKKEDLNVTTGYVNTRFFHESLSFGVAPKLYCIMAVPVIGPRTDNKWIKLYLPNESEFTISPHERLQVSGRNKTKFRLHNKNVPRWRFGHTRNFKLIVSAQKIGSTFVKSSKQQ